LVVPAQSETIEQATKNAPLGDVTEDQGRLQKNRSKLVRNLLISVGSLLFVGGLLTIGFFLNESKGWLEIGSWGEREVTNYTVAISFRSGTREGLYTGIIRRKLPNGQGEFIGKNSKGITYTLSGVWTQGVLDGLGKDIFEDGVRYEGEFRDNEWNGYGVYTYTDGGKTATFEGDFEKGHPKNTAEFRATLYVDAVFDIKSSYYDAWRKTVRENGAFFPAEKKETLAAVKKLSRNDVSYEQINKNPKKYQAEFVSRRVTISQIREYDDYTWFIARDSNWNIHYFVYLGNIEYVEGDAVTVISVPIANHSYANTAGNDVLCVAFLASAVYK
jgi:hypothetical protein